MSSTSKGASKENVEIKIDKVIMDIERHHDWDPMRDKETDTLTSTAIGRIKRDLMNLYMDPPPGIFVVGDEVNLKFIYALIVGPMGTPYEGGLFYFILKCPNNYPIQPPRVKLLTTDAGNVRFNPNLYHNGKVCVSILGTWSGPSWSPAQQLSSLLITIQSLLSEKPYFNEPGFEMELVPGDAQRYSDLITHETLRVAVCGMVENECKLNIPEQLKSIINKTFDNFYEQYLDTIEKNKHMTGTTVVNPFNGEKTTLNYDKILARLKCLHERVRSPE